MRLGGQNAGKKERAAAGTIYDGKRRCAFCEGTTWRWGVLIVGHAQILSLPSDELFRRSDKEWARGKEGVRTRASGKRSNEERGRVKSNTLSKQPPLPLQRTRALSEKDEDGRPRRRGDNWETAKEVAIASEWVFVRAPVCAEVSKWTI